MEEYPEGSISTSHTDELILLNVEDEGLQIGPAGGRSYGLASSSDITGMATDVNQSKIRPQVTLKVFNDAGIDAGHFYLIIPTPNDRAHNPPPRHMTVYTWAFSLG